MISVKPFIFFSLVALCSISCLMKQDLDHLLEQLPASRTRYLQQLERFKAEFGGKYSLPGKDFFLFGMGERDKLLYKEGQLLDASDGRLLFKWTLKNEMIIPNEYAVILETEGSERIVLLEDENGIWKVDSKSRTELDTSGTLINLPGFEEEPYSEILKVLHQEILVNIIGGRPLPNLFVYSDPWRRDAAMMAMCLERTGNIHLLKDWVLSLDDPFDHNNGSKQGKPESEADNLGQTLYLISLFSDSTHSLVPLILREAEKMGITENGRKYIQGRSDFQEVPVYQTKWMKFGLARLGMKDPYSIPPVEDNYSSLFWWDYTGEHVAGNEWRNPDYPYIGWARDHFYGSRKGLISDRIYPLTWERKASQANYEGMELIDTVFLAQKLATPHTWHASEIFLYLIDKP